MEKADKQIVLNKLVDVRVDSSQTQSVTHDAVVGGANVVRQSFRATTASSSNLDFVIQTPGLGQFVSRRVDIVGYIPFQFTVTNNSPAVPLAGGAYPNAVGGLIPGVDIGVEAFPMNSLITASTVQISTSSFTTQQQQIMPLMKRILRKSEKRTRISVTPTSLGATAVVYKPGLVPYPQGSLGGCVGEEEDAYANASSSNYITLTNAVPAPSAATVGAGPTNITTTTSWTVYGTLSINEPLLCQPFKVDDETMAFINTNLIQVRLNLSTMGADLARILKFASRPYVAISTTLVPGPNVIAVPDLIFSNQMIDPTRVSMLRDFAVVATFISPPGGAQVPPSTIYDTVYYNPLPTAYTQPIPFSNTLTSPTVPITTARVESSTITLNTAPDMVAIYFVPNQSATNDGRATYSYSTTQGYPSGGTGYCREDTLGDIMSINVSWNNNPSLFATFNKDELYRRSVANGLSVPYVDGELLCATALNTVPSIPGLFKQTYYPWCMGTQPGASTQLANACSDVTSPSTGMPVLLALNKDIPVEPNVAAGVAGVFTLKVVAQVANLTDYEGYTGGTLYVVPITSQYLRLNSGAMSDIIATVATEADVYRTPVVGDVQSKELVGAGRTRASADSHAVASSRQGFGRILSGGGARGGGMLHSGGAGGGGDGSGASQYVGAKRGANLMLM